MDGLEVIVRRYLPGQTAERPLARDGALADLGLTSLAAIDLVLEIEDHYNVMFPDALLTAETFNTLGSLEAAVSDLLAPEE